MSRTQKVGVVLGLSLGLVVCAKVAMGGGPASARPQIPERTSLGLDARSLYLKAGTLDLRNVPSLLQPGVQFERGVDYVVQLDGPITPERRSALLAAGVGLGAYLPRHAYVCTLDGVSGDSLIGLGYVAWVGPFQTAWKISPDIGRTNWTSEERQQLQVGGRKRLIVTPFSASDAPVIAPRAVGRGGVVRSDGRQERSGRLVLDVDPADVEQLAAMPEVMFIEEAGEMLPRNESTNWISQSNVSGSVPLWNAGLHGEGQIAGIIDWDLKPTHCSFNDAVNPIGPLHRKIVSYYGMGQSRLWIPRDARWRHVGGLRPGRNQRQPEGHGVRGPLRIPAL